MDFPPYDPRTRRYDEEFDVRLGEVDVAGTLRLDGVATVLQDVAVNDWRDLAIDEGDTWVVRRTALRWVSDRWPRYGERVRAATFCGGVGPAWALRRTTLSLGADAVIEAASLWVPIGPGGGPVRLRESFFRAYGEVVREWRISGRVGASPLDPGALGRPWALRRADLDVVGHANNAALWCALSEVATAPVLAATFTHYGSLELDDGVTLFSAPERMWLVVDDQVRVAADYVSAS